MEESLTAISASASAPTAVACWTRRMSADESGSSASPSSPPSSACSLVAPAGLVRRLSLQQLYHLGTLLWRHVRHLLFDLSRS